MNKHFLHKVNYNTLIHNILTYTIVCNIYKNLTRLFRFFFSFFSFYICSCYTLSYIYKQIICFSVTKIIEILQTKKKLYICSSKTKPKFLKKIFSAKKNQKPNPTKPTNQRPIENQMLSTNFSIQKRNLNNVLNLKPAFKFLPKTVFTPKTEIRNSL